MKGFFKASLLRNGPHAKHSRDDITSRPGDLLLVCQCFFMIDELIERQRAGTQ